MKPGKPLAVFVVAGALALGMAGCGTNGGTTTPTTTPPTSSAPSSAAPTTAAPVELTLSGWSLATTPEFQTLVDGFKKVDPNVNITIKEYDPAQYTQLMLADMTAKQAPDIITIKEVKYTYAWATAGQLLDISDITSKVPANVPAVANYTINGKGYAMPYRQDTWMLYYNKDLFDQAKVAIPNGKWTWEDYVKAAKDLTAALKTAGSSALGTYEHGWQSTLQGFANAQKGDNTNPNGPYYTGDYTYMTDYYNRALDLQTSGAQVTLGDIQTNKLTYQAQFGKQKAAMMLMGSWYIATLRAQQKSGDADKFTWGMAPAPQVDSSTVDMPVSFGDSTGMAINVNIDPAKQAAAKEFLTYVASEDAAKALAGIGITPAMASDAITAAVFAGEGMPTDALSKTAFGTHKTYPENASLPDVVNISTVLGTAHTDIMTGNKSVADALAAAGTTVKNKDW